MAEPAAELNPGLARFLDGVCTVLKGRLPALKTCELHGGRFDVQELKRLGTHAPAIYLSAMAAPLNGELGDGRRILRMQLTAFVVAKDAPGLSRDRAALNLVEALLLMIPNNVWGLAGQCSFPQKISAQNLYSGALDKTRLALWGVSWQQGVFAGQSLWPEDGVVPSKVYVGTEPETGTPNKDSYEQL